MIIKNAFRLLVTSALLLVASMTQAQGYRITLNSPDFANQQVILAEYFTSRMIPKDTVLLDQNGKGIFSGNEVFEGGMYVMFFNQQYYFDFLLDNDQVFSIKADSSNLLSKTRFEGSENNTLFYKYKRFLQDKRKEQEALISERGTSNNAADSARVQEKIDKLNDEIADAVAKLIKENEDTFFATFLNAMKDPETPMDIIAEAESKRQQDSLKYAYYKNHYFDNFDIGDIRLLHTPIYESKIKTYINNVVPPQPDSIIAHVDFLIEESRSHDAIFRFMLITLFNNYAESKVMGMDKVYFHIAEKYYIPEATWSDQEFITKLKENLDKSRLTFIGERAPDFELVGIPWNHVEMAQMDTAIKQDPHVGYTFQLNDIAAPYTIIYYWEADCGHCKKSVPALYEVFKKYKEQGVKLLAVHVINSVE
ncbi:MAG TPA: DUF5106 domain-containing protein, partial [Bacteroidales bacterium]|nr:DUF5106 domain-containing protein [Bacteroidales bacterium]